MSSRRYEKIFYSLDSVCTLKAQKIVSRDEIGQPIKDNVDKIIFCSELSVSSNEVRNAGMQGLKLSIVLLIDSDEYNGATEIMYNNKIYRLYRHYKRKDDGLMELYLL